MPADQVAQVACGCAIITLYCNRLALGRDSAHIIITPSLSNIYVQSLMSTSGHTLSGSSHTNLLSSQSQDSMHCGTSSGLDILIRKWVSLRDFSWDSM